MLNHELNTGGTLQDPGISSDFLNGSAIAKKIMEKISKWDCIAFKSFGTAKETSRKYRL